MVEKKIGTRRTCLFGGFWMCLGLALCAVCTHESSLLLISYGVITALGCGLCYSVPLASALKLSPPQDKGWVSGILFFARGLSICFMCPFQSFYLYASSDSYLSFPLIDFGGSRSPGASSTSLLGSEDSPVHEDLPSFPSPEIDSRSPDGERFLTDTRVLRRLPSLFLVMSIGFAILQLIGVILLVTPDTAQGGEGEEGEVAGPPEQQKLLYDDPRGTSSSGVQGPRGPFFYSSFSSSSSSSSLSSSLVLTPHDILSSVSFWLLFLMLFLSWQSLFFIQLTWKVLPLNPAAETAAGSAPSSSSRLPPILPSTEVPSLSRQEGPLHDAAMNSHSRGGEGNSLLESFLSSLLGSKAAGALGGDLSEGENPWAATGIAWEFINDHAMCLLGALLGGLCCMGRILWGYIGDGVGYMRSTILMNALVAPCLFALSTYGMQTPQLYASCMALIHLCQGGVFSLFPSLTSELFGRKNVGPVFSLLFGARLAAVALASLWTNIALHYTSLHVVCFILGTCHLLCIGATFFFHPTDAIPYRFPMYAS
ncbi:major facilitator family protein [Cystoisospora suis]|uniref:Major facilitator family protein n=1 Tax=Cystoisospora suis TaxID=483139 RepID=A0A2C6KHM1_9APIC|nr:major facilitator family protein [Cystoisospora suis]